ncbi:sensor histidine kinase [Paenibacillus sp. UNC499MF]|uniref:sensor histidine kinase n=1 Tax=Paenibacillus sp. UNC499MF TaxID=1502751 RepID=UPI00089FAB46|nr:sensor histidine kinase [Paenibacillus sp. UNC499MF]SEF53481.1 Signal transduction histidine kinase [Paenibacillus sp. UNC499MF]
MTKVIFSMMGNPAFLLCAILWENPIPKRTVIVLHLSLNKVRYTLIFVPAVASMYLEKFTAYGIYTLLELVLFLLVVLRPFAGPQPLQGLLLLAEIGYGAWLCGHYGGILYFSTLSAVFSYASFSVPRVRALFLGIHLLALNTALYGLDPRLLIAANGTLLLTAVLLSRLNAAAADQQTAVHLYDELRKKHFELDEAKNQLLDYARKVENAAQAEERSRISHELHDDLGHRLIRSKMMMEAAIQTLPGSPEQGMKLLTAVRDQLAESMEQMRATVKRMKPGTGERSYSLDRLIHDIGRETGIGITLDIEGLPYPLYPSLEIILYKNAREAVTNAVRHGNATEVAIKLEYESEQVRMTVSNNGAALPAGGHPPPVSGLGLSGMQERTRLVGGTLSVRGEAPFTVTTLLPAYRKKQII